MSFLFRVLFQLILVQVQRMDGCGITSKSGASAPSFRGLIIRIIANNLQLMTPQSANCMSFFCAKDTNGPHGEKGQTLEECS